MSEHIIPWKTYLWIWLALMGLMALTAGLSQVDLGVMNTVVALCIAVAKALLVILFFMHVKYESSKMVWVMVIAGFFWLFLLLGLSMTDYLSRMYLNVPGH